MRGLQFIPHDTNIRFMAWRRFFIAFSVTVIMCSVFLFIFKGFNLGIDFRGGLLLEVRTSQPMDLAQTREELSNIGVGEVSLQEFGSPDDLLIRLEQQKDGEAGQQRAVEAVKGALGPNVEYRRVEAVGPQVSAELFRDGIYALIAALLSIAVYLWFRFEWQFGIAGIASLIHDVVAILGVFSLLGYEFNLTIVAAVMTIAGYSINDSVVVFDRIRENLRKYKTMPFDDLLDLSINQTLSRTVMTSLTVILVVICLYVLGGEVLRGFSFAMLIGLVVGTYSSVFVAIPVLVYLGVREQPATEEKLVEEKT